MKKEQKHIESLFVYGTLAPGEVNHHLLSEIQGEWQPATVLAIKYESGKGEALGYPGLVLNENGKLVQGYILSSTELNEHWEQLDEFEGSGYNRVLTNFTLTNGSQMDAFVYVLHPSAIP